MPDVQIDKLSSDFSVGPVVKIVISKITPFKRYFVCSVKSFIYSSSFYCRQSDKYLDSDVRQVPIND